LLTTDSNQAAIWTIGKELPPLGVRLYTHHRGVEQDPIFLPGGVFTVAVHNFGTDLGFRASPIRHDPASGRPIGTLIDGEIVGPVAASPDGRLIVGRRNAGGVGIWDAHTHDPVAQLPPVPGQSAKWFAAPRWSPGGALVAADVAGAAYYWNVSDPRHPSKPVHVPTPQNQAVDDLMFTPDGAGLIIIGAGSQRVSLIDIRTGRPTWSRVLGDVGLRQVGLSPDGKTIAMDLGGIDGGHVVLLDAASGKREAVIATQSNGGVGFVDDGRWLVITTNQPYPQAQLYDLTTREEIGVPFPTAAYGGYPVVVNPDGTRFAEIQGDIYGHPTNVPLATLNAAIHDPLLWNVHLSGWAATACSIAGRNLTRAEWHQYLPDLAYQRTCTNWPAGS